MSAKNLKETIQELRDIPAKWKSLEDPVGELMKIRYGASAPEPDIKGCMCPRAADLADLRARLAARLASCEADADFGMVIRCADEAAWLRDLLREEAK